MILKQRGNKKPLLAVAACLLVSGLAYGSAFAYQQYSASQHSTDEAQTKAESVETTQSVTGKKTTPRSADHSESHVDDTEQVTSTKRSTESDSSSMESDDQSRVSSTYNEVESRLPSPQTQVVSCNETMKASYTSYRDSRISAEKARWANQVNGFVNEANARGMAFSGYVQEQINIYKPAHDAALASIEIEYQSNLDSIHCL